MSNSLMICSRNFTADSSLEVISSFQKPLLLYLVKDIFNFMQTRVLEACTENIVEKKI